MAQLRGESMESLYQFQAIAQYLTHPLVLVGFVLLLLFGVYRTLIHSGLIPPVTKRTGGALLGRILRYGFVIALTVIALGFLLRFFEVVNEAQATRAAHRAELAEQALKTVWARARELEDAGQRERIRGEALSERNELLAEAVHLFAQIPGP